MSLHDFPVQDIALKRELCQVYLNVMQKIKPGLNKMTGKNFKKAYFSTSCKQFLNISNKSLRHIYSAPCLLYLIQLQERCYMNGSS